MKSTKAARKAKPKAKAKAPSRKTRAATPAPVVKAPEVHFPVTAHVLKGDDRIAVEVKDQDHLDRLTAEHGARGVEVQS